MQHQNYFCTNLLVIWKGFTSDWPLGPLDLWASQVALVIKNLPANAEDLRDAGSIPGSGRSARGGHGNPLQYSSLENPTDRGAWQVMFHRIARSRTLLKWLNMHVCMNETIKVPKMFKWISGSEFFHVINSHHFAVQSIYMEKSTDGVIGKQEKWTQTQWGPLFFQNKHL